MTEDVKDNMSADDEQTPDVVTAETAEADAATEEQSTEPAARVAAHIDAVLIRRVLEAAILAADGPLDRDTMLSLFDEAERPDRDSLNLILVELADSYADRGIELKEVASGFRFQVRREMGPWVSRLWQEKAPRYSRAILETLALIAYRQPITRGEIEEIRGVAVNTQIVKTLLERNWVRIVGHRDVPGRPAMFATTRQFLDYFDLKSLEDLPSLSEIRDLDKINEELALEEAALSVPRGEDGEPLAVSGGRQVTIMEAIDNHEPEIDESTLMSLEQVDSVLSSFESEFRRKPGQPEEEPVAEVAEATDTDLFPDVDEEDELSADDAVSDAGHDDDPTRSLP
jgi:segregation and condensation protein B